MASRLISWQRCRERYRVDPQLREAPVAAPGRDHTPEHDVVFAELGFSDEQIGGYVASGALVSVSIPLLDRTVDEDLSPEPAPERAET